MHVENYQPSNGQLKFAKRKIIDKEKINRQAQIVRKLEIV